MVKGFNLYKSDHKLSLIILKKTNIFTQHKNNIIEILH